MAIESLNSYYSTQNSYWNSIGALFGYTSSLTLDDLKKTATTPTSGTSTFNQSLFDNLGNIKAKSTALQSQISSMSSLTQYSSAVGQAASYSNSGVLTASVASNAAVSKYSKTDVTVDQLASAQQNKSANLAVNENSFGGNYTVSITNSAGKTGVFSVNLTEADNNKTAMTAMADKINQSDIGVKATLVTNDENGTVSLRLDGTKTGETDGRFIVNDNTSANLGKVVSEASNALYSVNGQNYSSQTNNVKLTDGVTATLAKTGSTQITYSADTGSAVDKVKSFIKAFNDLSDSAANSPALKTQLLKLAGNYSRALGFSGIGVDSSGKLVINDEEKLKQSITNGSFAKNFQGAGSFGDKLSDITRNSYRAAYTSAVQNYFLSVFDPSNKSASSSSTDTLLAPTGLIFNGWA